MERDMAWHLPCLRAVGLTPGLSVVHELGQGVEQRADISRHLRLSLAGVLLEIAGPEVCRLTEFQWSWKIPVPLHRVGKPLCLLGHLVSQLSNGGRIV